MGLQDDLLLETLKGLRTSVDKLGQEQNDQREELHRAVIENTKDLGVIKSRVHTLEEGARRESRKWKAIYALAAGLAGTAVKVFIFGSKVSHP